VIDFVKRAFAAEESQSTAPSRGKPWFMAISRSAIPFWRWEKPHGQWQPMPTMLYLYVNDVDLLAISAGAQSLWSPDPPTLRWS
jgi:hypothetical protein